MGQDREPEAGKQKHNHREHRVLILERHTCFLVRFSAFSGTEKFLVVQLFHFRVGLNQIVHLSVPSENLNRRGKRDLENPLPAIWCPGPKACATWNASEKVKEMDLTQSLPPADKQGGKQWTQKFALPHLVIDRRSPKCA
jgi:hypothetical protein